jgi:predicted GH43/DUF377 family glycosyl hydrolase
MTSTEHNKALCEQVITANAVTCRYPKVSEQVETLPLDRSKLFAFGYNPSIVESEGFMVLAYRYHPEQGNVRTQIALAQIDNDGTVVTNRAIPLDAKSTEDPRLFVNGRWPWLSFVVSDWPNMLKSVVRYTEIVNGKPLDIYTPTFGKNDLSGTEKNWVFWSASLQLFCLYQTQPIQTVYRVDGVKAIETFESESPKWPYGQIRGGCIVPWDGKLLRFFHSPLDNEWFTPQQPRRYFTGCAIMEPNPPFKTIRVSRKPILYGSEVCRLKVKERPFHWKSAVAFPGGAVVRGDHIVLAVGTNDSCIELCKLTEKNLNL